MDLIAASAKEECGQHVHGWENITMLQEKAVSVLESKLVSVLVLLHLLWLLSASASCIPIFFESDRHKLFLSTT
jgi:hypothetical protein